MRAFQPPVNRIVRLFLVLTTKVVAAICCNGNFCAIKTLLLCSMMLPFFPAQRAVIGLSTGQHACLVPARSGKTVILTEQIYQALQQGIAPAQMLCLTFLLR